MTVQTHSRTTGNASTTLGPDVESNIESVLLEQAPQPPSVGVQTHEQSSTHKEWVPIMLRKIPAAILMTGFWVFAILLELIVVVIRNMQGISSLDKTATAAIILGFGWKVAISDLKVTTPWAALANTGDRSIQPIFLNCIDGLDIKSALAAFRNRHWALFLGLGGALISSALVPPSNALTHVNTSADVVHNVTLTRTSQFVFNGSLAILPGLNSILPKLAVDIEDPNRASIVNNPFTRGAYAFESFSGTFPKGGYFTAKVQAFTSSLNCQEFDYNARYESVGYNSSITLDATSALEHANCSSQSYSS